MLIQNISNNEEVIQAKAFEKKIEEAEEAINKKQKKDLDFVSPSKIMQTLYPYKGKKIQGAGDYGTAHHRVIQAVLEGELSVNEEGILDEDSVKTFLKKLATSTSKTKEEDREDVKGIMGIDKKTGILM